MFSSFTQRYNGRNYVTLQSMFIDVLVWRYNPRINKWHSYLFILEEIMHKDVKRLLARMALCY